MGKGGGKWGRVLGGEMREGLRVGKRGRIKVGNKEDGLMGGEKGYGLTVGIRG